MPMYDFTCAVCGETTEIVIHYTKRDLPVPHDRVDTSSKCTGNFYRHGVTPVAGMGNGMGETSLDGRHQTKAVIYDGERKVGHVDGHFGRSAKRERKK